MLYEDFLGPPDYVLIPLSVGRKARCTGNSEGQACCIKPALVIVRLPDQVPAVQIAFLEQGQAFSAR